MIALAIVAIVLAIAIPLGIELLKRPRLRIEAAPWVPQGPVPWIFAVVRVQNLPLPRPWSILLRRDLATGCEITAEFRIKAQGRALPPLACRWSGARPPVRQIPISAQTGVVGPSPSAAPPPQLTAGTAILSSSDATARSSNPTPGYTAIFDREALSDSYHFDIGPGKEGSEAAVAILVRDIGAFAFNAESYAYPTFAKPEWELRHADYEVTVTVTSGQIRASRVFSLAYFTDDFAAFRLEPVE
jgi:hypothetical protein